MFGWSFRCRSAAVRDIAVGKDQREAAALSGKLVFPRSRQCTGGFASGLCHQMITCKRKRLIRVRRLRRPNALPLPLLPLPARGEWLVWHQAWCQLFSIARRIEGCPLYQCIRFHIRYKCLNFRIIDVISNLISFAIIIFGIDFARSLLNFIGS